MLPGWKRSDHSSWNKRAFYIGKEDLEEDLEEDLGKTYARITLFLCPLEDASDSEPERACTSELESLSDEWLNDVDLTNDDADLFPAFDIFQRSPITASSTTACATTGGSFTFTTSTGIQCSSSGMCS